MNTHIFADGVAKTVNVPFPYINRSRLAYFQGTFSRPRGTPYRDAVAALAQVPCASSTESFIWYVIERQNGRREYGRARLVGQQIVGMWETFNELP